MAHEARAALRRAPRAVAPRAEIDWETLDASPSPEVAARARAERLARRLDDDHADALRTHRVLESRRLDPEGYDRERRAERREAQQLEMEAMRR